MSDKLNKNINESMLEGLLSDEDKPKPPKPVTTPYNYGNSSYRGGQGSFGWANPGGSNRYYDDEEDDAYYARTSYHGSRSRAAASTPASTPTSYSSGFDISAATINGMKQALEGGLHSGQKHYFMPAKEADMLAAAFVRGIGELMDKVGLSFGATGSKAAKALIIDMLASNMFYNTPTRGYKELDFGDMGPTTYDPETGEVLDDNDEERKAIQEVDGGRLTEEE